MSALEYRHAKGWGRIEMPGGSVSLSCDMCRAHKKQHPGGGTRLIFCLGRPFMRVCRKCEPKVKAIYEGAKCDA